jgi:tetratricopeptide (TPR) repeat protein
VASYLGLLSMVEGDVEQAVELCLDALIAGPPVEVAALARFTLMLSLASQGRQQNFLGLIDAAKDAGFLPANLFERQALQGMLALWSGQERPAAANLSAVLRDAPTGLLLQGRLMFQTGLAEALYRMGDWDGAASQAELAISLAEDAGIQLGLGNTYGVASYVSAGRGLWELAESQLAIASSSAEMLPWWGSRAYAAVARATVAQAHGDYPAITARCKSSTIIPYATGSTGWVPRPGGHCASKRSWDWVAWTPREISCASCRTGPGKRRDGRRWSRYGWRHGSPSCGRMRPPRNRRTSGG